MSRTRAKKGDKYFYLASVFGVCIVVETTTDIWSSTDFVRLESGNYFHTKEEAETCARKLRAVLKGAEVIEMPSKEELTEKIFSTAGEIVGIDREITVSDCMKTAKAVVKWLKDKIVK